MIADVRELLPLYALGILEPDEVNAVERAIAADPALAAELGSHEHAIDQLVVETAPPAHVKARLLASVGGGRFDSLSDRLATLFGVAVDRAREFLGLIERPRSWEPQEVPGISLIHFEGGPAYAAADCGFIRLTPGTMFPPHKHLGEEVSIILSGAVRVIDDKAQQLVLRPGDEIAQAEGSQHFLRCEGDEDCIFATRAMNGIEVAGAPRRMPRPPPPEPPKPDSE